MPRRKHFLPGCLSVVMLTTCALAYTLEGHWVLDAIGSTSVQQAESDSNPFARMARMAVPRTYTFSDKEIVVKEGDALQRWSYEVESTKEAEVTLKLTRGDEVQRWVVTFLDKDRIRMESTSNAEMSLYTWKRASPSEAGKEP